MFWKRLISGVVLLIAAVVLLYLGGVPLLAAVGLISLVGQMELYKAIGIDHKMISFLGYAMTVVYYILIFFQGREYVTAMIVGALLSFMTAYVITFPEFKTEEITGAFFGMCYVSLLMSHIWLTRSMENGAYLIWLVLLCSWGCDTCAYCTGMLIGKHRMAPKLSPKKTWEGTLGGVIGAGLLGLLYGYALRGHFTGSINPLVQCSFACAVGAVISVVGDLAASAIKRNHDIKDFGNCIPGHGGILDRFDSVLFSAPAIYYASLFAARFLGRHI